MPCSDLKHETLTQVARTLGRVSVNPIGAGSRGRAELRRITAGKCDHHERGCVVGHRGETQLHEEIAETKVDVAEELHAAASTVGRCRIGIRWVGSLDPTAAAAGTDDAGGSLGCGRRNGRIYHAAAERHRERKRERDEPVRDAVWRRRHLHPLYGPNLRIGSIDPRIRGKSLPSVIGRDASTIDRIDPHSGRIPLPNRHRGCYWAE